MASPWLLASCIFFLCTAVGTTQNETTEDTDTDDESCMCDPCLNHGSCMKLDDGYICLCLDHYHGKYCEKHGDRRHPHNNKIQPCKHSPCKHGGTCIANGTTYNCTCVQGYYGNRCERAKVCDNSHCGEKKHCVPYLDAFKCDCPRGYHGKDCELTESNSCIAHPCQNGGKCRVSKVGNRGKYTKSKCACPKNYVGYFCERVHQCASKPCLHGGLCQISGVGYRCICRRNYYGINCQAFAPCTSNPCLNNGGCEPREHAFACICAPGFEGSVCQHFLKTRNLMTLFDVLLAAQLAATAGNLSANSAKILSMVSPAQKITNKTQCAKDTCFNDGKCTEIASFGYICDCPPAYEGRNCEVFDPCGSNPCQNNGICEVRSDDYSCSCTPDFSGMNCHDPSVSSLQFLDERESNITDDADTRQATAVPPVELEQTALADTVINPPVQMFVAGDTGPALVAGKKTSRHAHIRQQTEKKQASGTGIQVGTKSSPCSEEPCLHNGTCVQSGHTFECRCIATYSGSNCEILAASGSVSAALATDWTVSTSHPPLSADRVDSTSQLPLPADQVDSMPVPPPGADGLASTIPLALATDIPASGILPPLSTRKRASGMLPSPNVSQLASGILPPLDANLHVSDIFPSLNASIPVAGILQRIFSVILANTSLPPFHVTEETTSEAEANTTTPVAQNMSNATMEDAIIRETDETPSPSSDATETPTTTTTVTSALPPKIRPLASMPIHTRERINRLRHYSHSYLVVLTSGSIIGLLIVAIIWICFVHRYDVKPTAEDSVEKVPLITAKTLHHLDNDANFCYADESYHDDDDGKAPGHHKHSRHHRHGNRRRHGSKHQKYHHKQKTQPQIVENQTSTSGTRDMFVEDVIRPRSASPLYRESPAAPELPPPPSEPPQGFPRRSTFPEITLTADNPMARPRSQTEPSMLIIQADQNEGSYDSVGHNNSNNCNNSNEPGTECTGLGGPTHDGLIDSWTSGRHQGGTSVTSHQGQ